MLLAVLEFPPVSIEADISRLKFLVCIKRGELGLDVTVTYISYGKYKSESTTQPLSLFHYKTNLNNS